MDQGLRSTEVFVKKKSSSGCLIIKKKIIPSGGVGPLPRKAFGSNETRERLERRNSGLSVSGFSEKTDRFFNDEGIFGNNGFGRNKEFDVERRRKFDDVAFDENVGMYRKRTRRDDLEERYSEGNKYGNNENRSKSYLRGPLDKPIRVQGKNGVLKVMINKSKNVNVLRKFYEKYIEDGNRDIGVNTNLSVGPSLYSNPKHCENACSSVMMGKSEPKHQNSLSVRANTGDSETDGSDFSLIPKSTSMINRKNDMHMIHRSNEYRHKDFVGKGSKLEIDINKNAPVTPVAFSDSKVLKTGNKLLKEKKSDIDLQNSLSKKAKKDKSETETSDSSMKQEPRIEQVGSSSKGVKQEEKAPSAEKAIFVRGKETKVKRGTGTEKQLLREKIRHKLVSSGWTINYRPRKNRDYLDAVYINPMGTAYWSIIKAYEAFKKQVGEEDVPEELLNKLTRQTRKKMEKEMKMKQREEARGKISKDVPMENEEEDTENDDNDKKANFSKKQIAKSPKQKAEKPFTLLIRSFDKSSKSQNDGYVPYMGKRTIFSWLIDSGIIHESAKVQYMNRKQTKIMLKGWVSREGVHCGCCNKIVTVSKFEIHAGSKLRQPFQNIYLESGKSLLQCQIEAWNRQDEAKRCGFHDLDIESDDGNDDACGVCGDGGDLMCCDGCPSTFHQSCMGIQALPFGDWHCPNCMCKFCERSNAQGNALLTCRMCERKYHKSCKEETDASCADIRHESVSFCGKKCQEVFNQLQKLLEVKHELEAGFSWSLIHRADIDTDVSQHGISQKVECNSKLAVALSVVEECFLPIKDRRSGINLIHNILYNRGSNYSRLNHSGFYTAILERGDEIIAAASIRIHGIQLAEMPFIGTRHIYRRQGMCRRLLCAIELALLSLKVEKLIIPAIGEHMPTWTEVFGFNPLEEGHKKEMRSLKMFVFPRTVMLQKMLVEQNIIREHLAAESGAKSIFCIEKQHLKSGSCSRPNVSNGNELSSSSSDIPSYLNLKDSSKDKINRVRIEKIVNSSNNLITNAEEVKKDRDYTLNLTKNGTEEGLEQSDSEETDEDDN